MNKELRSNDFIILILLIAALCSLVMFMFWEQDDEWSIHDEIKKEDQMSEANLQQECNAYLEKCGILFYHREKGFHNKKRDHSKDLPDLMIWHNGLALFVELKDEGKKQTPGQIEWDCRSRRAGIPYYVCYNFNQFVLIMQKEEML